MNLLEREHQYSVTTQWTGNLGAGTSGYKSYSRDHTITGAGKSAAILGSSDPVFRGDGTRYNPEELFVASLSSCHMLWMLHLCADAGIVVHSYSDEASGTMVETESGAGQFSEVVLRPRIVIDDVTRMIDAMALHDKAHELCFIARSVRCHVRVDPSVVLAE